MEGYIVLKDLFRSYKIDVNKKYSLSDIEDFYHRNKSILFVSWDDLEQNLATMWTGNKFTELLEMLYSFELFETPLHTSTRLALSLSDSMKQVEKEVFRKHDMKYIYSNFILPSAIVDKSKDSSYSDGEKKYIADLSMSLDEANEQMKLLHFGFDFDKNTSLEMRRLMRKKMFDITFTMFFRDEHSDFTDGLFENIDNGLKKEVLDGTDKEWWSLHNVMYGFISWKNTYKVPHIWINNNSHYSFLYFVFDAMYLLDEIIKKEKILCSKEQSVFS
jgi:hypothetical protein